MRRFTENMHIRSLVNPESLAPEQFSICKDLLGAPNSGSASDTVFGQTTSLDNNLTFKPSKFQLIASVCVTLF